MSNLNNHGTVPVLSSVFQLPVSFKVDSCIGKSGVAQGNQAI